MPPRPHAALIVDSDPKGLESLVYGFQGAGWRITACPTPETASLLVKASGAEIVVVASRTDHSKAQALVRQLRSRESSRVLPVLLLGPEELRQSIKQHGEADLLPLPAFVRDVLTASQLIIGTGGTAAQKPGEEPCFEDGITAQGTLSLVRTMNGLARSGSLHLVRKGRHGEILFHEGELTAAQVGQLQAMAAVQHLLVWNDGSLELRLRPVVKRGQLHQSAQEFLEEFDRFQRDYTHGIKDIGPPSTVYLVNHERLRASPGSVPAEVTPVVRLCDGQRNLCDVIDESPFRVLDTVRILGRLVELAILNRRDEKPSDPSGARTPLDEFWATARITVAGEAQAPARRSGSVPIAAQPMPAAPVNPADPAAKDAGPFDSKPRPQRQTLELGTPASRSSGELPATQGVPAIHTSTEAEAIQARTHEAQATPAEVGRRLTPAMGLSGLLPRPSPAAGVPVVQPTAAGTSQTSGAFNLRKTGHQTQQTMRAAGPRRSVVIDTALVDVVAASPATAAPIAAATTAPPPTAAAPTPVPAPSLPPPIVGEMQVAPSGTTAPNIPAPANIAVKPDVSRPAEPPAPNLAAIPLAEAVKEAPGSRVTGEMQVVSSGKSRTQGKIGNTSSFHIDPSLAVHVQTKTEHPRRNTPSADAKHGIHRPSGSFSAIESDFFEREAELYEVDKTESFADLDDGKGKPAAKNGAPDRKR